MALSVQRAGLPLLVYDLRPEPLAELAGAGAQVASSSREAAAKSDVLVIMVLNHAQAETVLAGENGALAGLSPGKTVIVMSTISPAQARHLASLVAPTGARYVDSPVSGGWLRAKDGTLTLMLGGTAEAVEAARPVLEAMGKYLYYAGAEVGSGQSLKMINQTLMGIHEVAASEAMVLATKLGLDPELIYEVISHGTGDSWAFRNRVDRLMARDFTNRGALEILHKDLGIVLEAARDAKMPLLLTPMAYLAYQAGMVAGLAREDDSAVAKILEQLAGVEVKKRPAKTE
jgi:3-hydroxyisobutyrate dehydrogenase